MQRELQREHLPEEPGGVESADELGRSRLGLAEHLLQGIGQNREHRGTLLGYVVGSWIERARYGNQARGMGQKRSHRRAGPAAMSDSAPETADGQQTVPARPEGVPPTAAHLRTEHAFQ